MAGDEQVERGRRPTRRPEADMEFPSELGHRGSERVHVNGGEEFMYASPAARIRRPLPEFPGRKCRHLEGASTSLPFQEFRRSRDAAEMIDQDTGVDDNARRESQLLPLPSAPLDCRNGLLPQGCDFIIRRVFPAPRAGANPT